MQQNLCLCGSEKDLSKCCGPLLDGEESADTPEALMRSRYSAFALKKIDYILETTDPQTRLKFDMKSNQEWAETSKFLKLEILKTNFEGNKGMVEFKAHYQIGVEPITIHHEISKFRKQAGIWYFRDGKMVVQEPNK